jgi:phage terminase small subunit
MGPLKNQRHEAFAQALAKGMTADAAYAAAGYTPSRKNAARLKANEGIRARVEVILSRGAQKAEIDVAKTLTELGRVGFSDIRRLFHDDGSLKQPHELDDDIAAAVASMEVVIRNAGKDEDGNPIIERVAKLKLWDKNSALEKIAKHLGMLADKQVHDVTDRLAALMKGGARTLPIGLTPPPAPKRLANTSDETRH